MDTGLSTRGYDQPKEDDGGGGGMTARGSLPLATRHVGVVSLEQHGVELESDTDDGCSGDGVLVLAASICTIGTLGNRVYCALPIPSLTGRSRISDGNVTPTCCGCCCCCCCCCCC